MVVAQSLISNIKIHCVGVCGVKRRSYQILNNCVCKAQPLCNLTRCTALWKSDIPMKIRHYDKASNIDGIDILFNFIFIPIGN